MALSDELQKLEELRRNGTITDDEFEMAKRKVLEAPQDGVRYDQFELIKAQNEVAQLDRAWELERGKYMVPGRYGQRYIPDKATSVLGGILVVGFGIFWTIMASSMSSFSGMGGFSMFPLFGVLFILFGAGMSISAFVKAGQYRNAQQRYLRRRREILNRNRTT